MSLTVRDRQRLEETVTNLARRVFNNVHDVSVHSRLSNAETRHSGVYASIILRESVTRSEREQLEADGIYVVENAPHVIQNPDMDEDVDHVSVRDLPDAADVETELVVELSEDLVPGAR